MCSVQAVVTTVGICFVCISFHFISLCHQAFKRPYAFSIKMLAPRILYGMGHKKVPVFIKQRPCNRNFAFRFRVHSIVQVSVVFYMAILGPCNSEKTGERMLKERCKEL